MNNMYGNPFLGNYGYPQSYPQFPQQEKQQPITQNFQLASPMGQSDIFMAQFLKEGQNAEDIFINNKTAFIDLKNKELKIREVNGNVAVYGLVLPRDEKDIKIEALENQINDLKEMIKNESNANVSTVYESTQQTNDGSKPIKSKSTAK